MLRRRQSGQGIVRLDLTYEELKLDILRREYEAADGLDLTYEELKHNRGCNFRLCISV